tara:strand:- start:3423 stop:3677 length:255 start_codon:yes stop_codon:yes gene_type:complete
MKNQCYINVNEINEYKNQLTEKQKIAMEKAVEILGDSFEIEKSIGFIEWKKNNQTTIAQLTPHIEAPIETIKFKPKIIKTKKKT